MKCSVALVITTLILTATVEAQNRREAVVRQDKARLEADASWIYNNVEEGLASAKEQTKPLLILIRCVP